MAPLALKRLNAPQAIIAKNMSNTIKQEDLEEKKPLPSEGENGQEDEKKEKGLPEKSETPSTEQDPLKTELDKVNSDKKVKRSKKEKLLFTKKRVEEQLKEFKDIDPEEDIPALEEVDEDKPVTVGMLNKIAKDKSKNVALEMADKIESETERELVKFHLENSIVLTGDAEIDLDRARAIVNALKNKQIIEEVKRKPETKTYGSGTSANKKTERSEELQPNEIPFTKPPFNLSKEDIIKARQ